MNYNSQSYLQLQEVVRGINRPVEAGSHRRRGPVLGHDRPDLRPIGLLPIGPCDFDAPFGDAARGKRDCLLTYLFSLPVPVAVPVSTAFTSVNLMFARNNIYIGAVATGTLIRISFCLL